MNKAVFLTKKKISRAINACMNMEDKIDWSIYSLDELILNLGESRTKLLKLTKNDSNKESIKTIECKIKQIYEKRKELFTKKEELIAKETLLKSQLDTAKMTSEHNLNYNNSFDSIVEECDSYIKDLESQLNTQEFLNSLS